MEINYIMDPKYRDTITRDDIVSCISHAKSDPSNAYFKKLNLFITIDSEGYVGYELIQQPIERIRRITGYLVGTTERWNDAKRQELEERVKHLK